MKNYGAWDINPKKFPEHASEEDTILFLIHFAVLAPSSHNSQPWRFIVKNRTVDIFVEKKRALPVSDENGRQLFISIGCAIYNLLVAAEYFSYTVAIDFFPERAAQTNCVARLSFEKSGGQKETAGNHLLFSIPQRHTNRSPYRNQKPEKSFLDFISSLHDESISVTAVAEQNLKEKLGRVVSDALIAAMDDPAFRKELSQYVKSNITQSAVGMPLFGWHIPTPLSLVGPFLLRAMNLNRITKSKDLRLLTENTPVFVIISSRGDTPRDWILVGMTYERIALEAVQNGLATHPLAAAIQIGTFYQKIQEILQTSLRPQFFFRLGYPTRTVRASPRLGAAAVMKAHP